MAGSVMPGKKRRNKQSSLAKRYLASIDVQEQQHQQQAEVISSPQNLTLTPNSGSRRSKSPHSKKSARTAVTVPTLDQSGSGSWTEASPGRGALSTSLDLTTPGSMQGDRFSTTPGQGRGQGSSSPPRRTFALFPATSPGAPLVSRGDHSDNSTLSSRRTAESSAATGNEKLDDSRFKDDFVGASIYSTSLVESHEMQKVSSKHKSAIKSSLEKSIELFVEGKAWGACAPSAPSAMGSSTAPSAVGSSTAPTEVATNRASDWAKREQHRTIALAPSEAATEVATNRAVDMAMKRVREMQNADYTSTLNEAKQAVRHQHPQQQHQQQHQYHLETKHPSRICFGERASNPRHLEAKSILSLSSNESSRIKSPLLSGEMDKSRLGKHMMKDDSRPSGGASIQSQSVSSSVGVETGDKNGIRVSGPNKAVWRNRRGRTIEAVHEVDEEDDSPVQLRLDSSIPVTQDAERTNLLLPELNDGDESRELSPVQQKKKSTGQNEKRTFTVNTATGHSSAGFPTEGDPCASPPTIQRYLQTGSAYSPDPIFCAHRSPNSASRFSGSETSESVWNGLGEASVRSASVKSTAETSNQSDLAEIMGVRRETIHRSASVKSTAETSNQSDLAEIMGVRRETVRATPRRQQPRTGQLELDVLMGVLEDPIENLFGVQEVSFPNVKSDLISQQTDSSVPQEERELANETLKEAKSRVETFARASKRVARRWPPAPSEDGTANAEMQLSAAIRDTTHQRPPRMDTQPSLPPAIPSSKPTARAKSFSGEVRTGASSFLAAISAFENSGVKSTGLLSSNSERSRGTTNRLGKHFGHVKDAPVALGRNEASAGIDVHSLRSTFEPSVASPDTLEEDDDDDTASVKDLRDRIEAPTEDKDAENGISRVRAMFEAKIVPVKRFGRANSELKDTFAKFEAKSRPVPRSRITKDSVPSVPGGDNRLPETIEGTSDQKADIPKTAPSSSVADRIRAFGGPGKASKLPAFHRKSVASRAPPPPPLPPPSAEKETGANADTEAGATEGVQVAVAPRAANPSFRDNLKLFSGMKQQEEAAKVVATSAFRERISQFSVPSRKEDVKVGARPLKPEPSKTPPAIPVQFERTGVDMEQPRPDILKPVPVKRELSSAVTIKPVAVRPTGTLQPSRSPSRVLVQYWRQPEAPANTGHTNHAVSSGPTAAPTVRTDILPPATLGIAPRTIPPNDEQYPKDHHAPTASPDRKSATLQPKRQKNVVSGLHESMRESDQVSATGSSEFSDGVTLDISIAEVSGLTLPTALVSKAGDKSVSTVDEDCDEELKISESTSKEADPIETEAKRSEASSSQPSEAAAPLIAKAMRMRPMSDDLSAEGFFAGQAFLSKHWSKKSGWELGASAKKKAAYIDTPSIEEVEEEEEEKKDDELLDQEPEPLVKKRDESGGWDLRRVETSFPVKESAAGDMFNFDSEWQPFPPDPFLSSSEVNVSMSSRGSAVSGANVSMSSRATTPTRRNTSRQLPHTGDYHSRGIHNAAAAAPPPPPPRRYAADEYSATAPPPHSYQSRPVMHHNDEVRGMEPPPPPPPRRPEVYGNPHTGYKEELRQSASENFAPPSPSDDWEQSLPASHSMPSQHMTSSPPAAGSMFGRTHPRRPDPTWKRRAGLMAAQARPDSAPQVAPTFRPPVPPPPSGQDGPPSQPFNTFGRINRGLGKYGAQHAALMGRLRSLKEARMRRASAMYNRKSTSTSAYPSSDSFAPFGSQSTYVPPDDELSHSTMSSTKFGGQTFLAALEVD